jgi:glycosyltransferase involved in cell wall biosynthesis
MLHQVLVSRLVGGAGLVAIHLAASARRRGIRTLGWVPDSGPASEALDREHVAWRRYHLEAMRGSAVRQLSACAQMLPGLIGWERPVVHVHNPVVYRFLRPALVAARARLVVHFQIEPSKDEIEWTLQYPPDHVVTCARYIAAQIVQVLGARGTRLPVSAVPNAVDLQRFKPGSSTIARTRVGLPTDRFVVVVIANLSPHKGQATALRAMRVLKARGVAVECWLVGEDRSHGHEYERELRALCSELGVDHEVRFLGFRADAPEILRAADAFLLPSATEGLPLSLIEAQASRVPVIGSSIPGILEVVADGKTGFIVPADDAVGYADRIQLLVERRELRHELADAAAAQVRREYDWSTLEERMFRIYRSLRGNTGAERSGDEPENRVPPGQPADRQQVD